VARPITATTKAIERFALHTRAQDATLHRLRRDNGASTQAAQPGDDDPTDPESALTLLSLASVEFAARPDGSYVVVLENKNPHHTRASAQVLPDLPFFGVVGTLSTSGAIDVYRLTLNENADQLNFGLAFQSNGSTGPMNLQVFNGAGQLLGEWSAGGQGTSVLLAQLGPQAVGSTFYLSISAGNPLGLAASSAGISYQLWVSRESATDPTLGFSQSSPNAPASAISPLSSGALTPLAALAAGPMSGMTAASAAVPATTASGSVASIAVGSPATRAGRPSVEALSSGDSERATERDLEAVAQTESSEQAVASSAIEKPNANDSRSMQDDGVLVAMNGPSGYALLAAVAVGHRRRIPAATSLSSDFVATPPPAESAPEPRVERIAPPVNAIVAEQTLVADRSTRHGLWDRLPKTLFSGLGPAIVFTVNAVLSQPFAGFDYLAARFDWNRGKRRRIRGGAEH
jgi:hypothetical protein